MRHLVDGCECDGSLVDCPHRNRLPPPIDDYGLCVPVSDQVYDNVVRPTGNFARPATVCPGVAGAVELPFDVIRSQIRSLNLSVNPSAITVRGTRRRILSLVNLEIELCIVSPAHKPAPRCDCGSRRCQIMQRAAVQRGSTRRTRRYGVGDWGLAGCTQASQQKYGNRRDLLRHRTPSG